MVYDFRQANKDPLNTVDSIIVAPDDKAMGEELHFSKYDSDTDTTTDIYYLIKPNGDSFALYREEHEHDFPYTLIGVPQPITEDMHQLVKVYFVRSGGKVIVIVVGKLKYFGKERTISFSSLVFSRN